MADSRQKTSQHATKRKNADSKEVAAKKKDIPTKDNNMAKAAKPKENPNIVITNDTTKSVPVPTTNKRKPRPPQLQPPSNQNKRIKLGPSASEKLPTLPADNQNKRIKLTKTIVTEKPSSVSVEQPPPALLKVMVSSSGSSITTSTTSVSSEVSSTARNRTTSRTDVRSTDVLLKLTDQYRMEITDLKQALASEKASVRTLR